MKPIIDLKPETIPLDRLRYGHEAKPPINVRHSDTTAEVENLAASLKTHGMIQKVLVQYQGKVPFIADGQRRVAAQRLRASTEEIPEDEPVECLVIPQGVDAHEISLSLAATPVPVHEADRYEAFSRLAKEATLKKLDPIAAIQSRFGVTAQYARRVVALGELSPKVLDAWRADKLAEDAIRAFTLAPIADQERALKSLSRHHGKWHIEGHAVRRALGLEGQGELNRLVRFVGRAAYEAAGGTLTEDLFSDGAFVVNDAPLAKRLADKKIAEEVGRLTADEGWGWASAEADLDPNVRYMLRTDPEAKGAKTARADRGRMGVVVGINHEGKLENQYGKLKPGQKPKPKKAAPKKGADGKEVPAEPALTNALAIRMSEGLTRAAKEALKVDPHAALAALLAGILAHAGSGERGPVKVRVDGAFESGLMTAGSGDEFSEIFAEYVRMSDAELLEACAAVAPETLNLTVYNAQAELLRGEMAGARDRKTLLEGIIVPPDSATISEHVRNHFDPEDYLKSVPRALKLRAIEDISPGEAVRSAEKLKSADLAKRAIAVVSQGEGLKWLPAELRTNDYAGPGAVAKKATAAKKPAAKKKVPAKKKK